METLGSLVTGRDEEDIFKMTEVPYTMTFLSPKGEQTSIDGIARRGPAILGHNATSLIIPSRDKKPYDYCGKPEFTLDEVEKLYRMLVANSTSTGSINQKHAALEPLLGNIVEERRRKELEECIFCYPHIESETPIQRIYHKGLNTEQGRQVISVPNISPFMPNHHITIFADHKIDSSELTYNDIANYFKSGKELAELFRKNGALGIVDFMNWGPEAAASRKHPHAQRGKLIEGMESHYRQIKNLRYFNGSNGDVHGLMEEIMKKIEYEHKELFVFQNKHIFVYAPFAPIFPDQTEVIFKGASNILDFSDYDLEIAARSMLGVIHGLRERRNVTDFNLVLHQSDFSNGGEYIMRAVIYPRNKNKAGGFELGQGVYVVPSLPENTAKALREHYNQGIK